MFLDFFKQYIPLYHPKVSLNECFISVFTVQTIVFFLCQYLKDNSLVDIVWPILFIIPNLMILQQNDNWNERTTLVMAMVIVWALRLSVHNLKRHRGEDKRYHELRLKWERHGKLFYYLMTFFFVFMLQAAMSLVINASAMQIMLHSKKESLSKWDWYGASLSFIGFFMEVIADH